MKKTSSNNTKTTIQVYTEDRDRVRQIARNMGISQCKCLSLILEEKINRDKINNRRKQKEFEQLDLREALNHINIKLEKLEKQNNVRDIIVSFFRTQEKEILNPMNTKIESLLAIFQELLTTLNSK